MVSNPAKFLDKILTILSSHFNNFFDVEYLGKVIYKYPKSEIKNGKIVFNMPLTDEHKINIINYLMFLNSEGLVTFDEKKEIAFINTKGFIKIKTESFVQEIRNKKINILLQRFAWVAAILAFIVTASIQVPKIVTLPYALNCNCDKECHIKN
jgi:hypothetical protein